MSEVAPDCVLVVEDDPAICALVSDIVSEIGLETICVHTDREAYAQVRALPALRALIVDINLGAGTTGFDVARFARNALPDLPIIYVTGEASETSFKAFGVPGAAFIEKPFTPDDLQRALQAQAVGRAGLLDAAGPTHGQGC